MCLDLSAPRLLSENNDKIAESSLYTHRWQKKCAAVLHITGFQRFKIVAISSFPAIWLTVMLSVYLSMSAPATIP
jgi:hypothetical protein